MDFPELSAALLERKLDNVEATGAELLVTDCPGCVLQLKGGMDKRGSKDQGKTHRRSRGRGTKRGLKGRDQEAVSDGSSLILR